ncbi:MAG: hypothetical protein FWB80_12945, partial [Defluviitaleaceae bacterium]|nr:hypothetical protein [Defluviitaleaceae bacterium]
MKKIFSLATLFAFVLVAAVACSADNYTAEIPTEIYVEIPPQVVKPPPTPTPETPPPPKETHPPDDAPPP